MSTGSNRTRQLCSAANAQRSVRDALLVAILLLTPVAACWSQEAPSTQRTVSTATDSPFSALNESLAKSANALIASAQGSSVGGDSNLSGVPTARPAIPFNAQSSSISGISGNSLKDAMSRLALLRPVVDPILRRAGVPTELAAVVLVESGGNPAALSPKGARGLWQLMPETARRYGLTVNSIEDDRLDVEKSTDAAAHYLSDLYSELGSWPLALAAYNTGEQNLQAAIERSRSTDFTVLSSLGLLPLETRSYVPAVLAVATRLMNSPVAVPTSLRQEQSADIVFAVAERSN